VWGDPNGMLHRHVAMRALISVLNGVTLDGVVEGFMFVPFSASSPPREIIIRLSPDNFGQTGIPAPPTLRKKS